MKDRIEFPTNTLVKIDGLPFRLESDTVLLGNKSNLGFITTQGKLLGEPSKPLPAQVITSETIKPSSESMKDLK